MLPWAVTLVKVPARTRLRPRNGRGEPTRARGSCVRSSALLGAHRSLTLTEHPSSCILRHGRDAPDLAWGLPRSDQRLPGRRSADCRLPALAGAARPGAERLETDAER